MVDQADQTQSVRTALEFLENPHKLWATGELANQRAVLKLIFSEPLAWKRNEGVRTAKTTLPFKYLGDFCSGQLIPDTILSFSSACED